MLLTEDVDHDGVSKQQRKSHQHPGEKWSLEVHAEEVHGYERLSFTPHVHQHDDEGLTQEEDLGKQTQQLQAFRLNTSNSLVLVMTVRFTPKSLI